MTRGERERRISAVRVRAVEIALERPVETAGGTMTTAPLVLVDVRTDDGVVGSSYVRSYTPVALGPLARLVRNVARLLEGAEASPEPVAATLNGHFRLLGPQGLTGIAMAAIDMALWDVAAKSAAVPLARLLGGSPDPIPAYASLRSMAPAAAAEEAGAAVARGFTAVKAKVGRADLAADLEVIGAIRAAVGDATRIMVDYNQSLPVDEAIERARALDAEGLHWIEEPTRADDYEGHARIAASATTPVQLGENWWGPADMQKSLAARASDHVTLDAMKLGGITGWLRAAALAEQAGLPASSHTFPEVSVHLLAVTPTAHMLEYLDHAGAILAEPIRIRDGHAIIPDRTGCGITWDEDAVTRWAADV